MKLHLLLYIRIKMYALNLLLFRCKSQHFVVITKIFPSRGSNVASHYNAETEKSKTDARRWMCVLELKVLQIIHFTELSLASKPGFFSNLNSPLMIQSFLCHQTVWINFTSDMILSRCFDFYMFMKFQMNGITSLHGMNKRHQETNYCAFDDNRKLRATKVAISFMLKAT